MKRFISKVFMLCVITFPPLTLAGDAQRAGHFYHPRHVDRLCPPEYRDTQERMENFMIGHRVGHFQELFGTSAPVSMAEVEVLNDEEDADACRYFRQRYDEGINKQVRLFDGGEAYYLHDITFYKGGDFYFVVIGGGFLVDEDPKGSGEERLSLSEIDGVMVYNKQDFQFVDWEAMD